MLCFRLPRIFSRTVAKRALYTSTNKRNAEDGSATAQKFSFNSEPLGTPASSGYGYAYLDFGEAIGGGRYIVKRKLGWGLTSSSWLAFDQNSLTFGEHPVEHVFIATNLFGGDVRRLMVSCDTTPFPLKLAKRILLHTLRGIAGAHGAGIIHTDLKHDNIFFKNALSTEQIDSWLPSDPPRRHAPELSEDPTITHHIYRGSYEL
ncbi:hypothetical protein VKT23_009732 [Stygiomarasmius scandens]|uniref:non-specific serine/threonine protein kinase n=1 Tax=Marasmiellus scandens TaxID=2682957 RepID=A0ABR1JHA9_9AGAR